VVTHLVPMPAVRVANPKPPGSSMAQLLFWMAAVSAVFTYAGYPALLVIWSACRRREIAKVPWLPHVSIVLPVHNGERYISRKLANLLALDYPPELLEILLVSDGSTDRTLEIARQTPDPRIKITEIPVRKGKPTAINVGVARAGGEVVVFNDVRQVIDPSAVRSLVANLHDPTVGAVTGQFFAAQDSGTVAAQLGLYGRYEQWIRKKESEIHSMIGAAGALCAIRRTLFRPLPPEVLLDDIYIPMQIVFRGYRTVFEADARAYDPVDHCPDFYRKLRTLTGNYQILRLQPDILSFRNPVLLQYLCHKVSRLLVPFSLLLMLSASAYLHSGFYAAALIAQLLFYAAAMSSRWLQPIPGLGKLSATGFAFLVANCAAFLGLFMFIRGKRDIWV
jgi:poly-beta-1,6-N-acetyl-D-glucosamine synthase